MLDEMTWYCPACKKQIPIKTEEEKAPVCCHKDMVKMRKDQCLSSPSDAEHARPMDADEPCDDGR